MRREFEQLELKVGAIEKCGEDDIAKMLYLTGMSRGEFVEQTLDSDFPEDEIDALISQITGSPLVPKRTRGNLMAWGTLNYSEKERLLGEAYDALIQLPERPNP